jgi:hypothetical protein
MNYRSDRDTKLEINLSNVCIASRNFQVKQLEGQVYPDHTSNASTLQIGWQERLTLHYLVVPIEMNADSSIRNLPCSSDNGIACENILLSKNRTHVVDFMCRERAHEVFTVSCHFTKIYSRMCLVHLMLISSFYRRCFELTGSKKKDCLRTKKSKDSHDTSLRFEGRGHQL